MVKQNKYTPKYKKALLKSIIQALDKTASKFTKYELETEITYERFTIIDNKLIFTGYVGNPTFLLQNPPHQELLTCKNTILSSIEVEGELELIG